MHSKSPCRRRDEGFRNAGEDDSENRGFRDLKKYYVNRYGCPIKEIKKDTDKNKVNLLQMNQSDEEFLLTSKFWP